MNQPCSGLDRGGRGRRLGCLRPVRHVGPALGRVAVNPGNMQPLSAQAQGAQKRKVEKADLPGKKGSHIVAAPLEAPLVHPAEQGRPGLALDQVNRGEVRAGIEVGVGGGEEQGETEKEDGEDVGDEGSAHLKARLRSGGEVRVARGLKGKAGADRPAIRTASRGGDCLPGVLNHFNTSHDAVGGEWKKPTGFALLR